MECIICKQEAPGGVVAFAKGKCFIQLGAINPDDFDGYQEEAEKLLADGWEETIICNDCRQVI